MLDICVLTAGRWDFLQRCLGNLRNELEFTPCKYKVYLLDNGSKNRLGVDLDKVFGGLEVARHKRLNNNVGFPEGANTAIRMGNNPLVMFLSDDIFLQPDSIRSMLKVMEDKTIGLCGMKLLFDEQSEGNPVGTVQHVGHSINLRGDITHPFMGWSSENPKCNQSGDRISVTGAVFMVRRELFNRVGGFSAEYGKGYYEDVEMALRIKALGYRIYCDCNAVATHVVGGTFTQTKDANLMRSKEIFLQRNRQFLKWDDWELR